MIVLYAATIGIYIYILVKDIKERWRALPCSYTGLHHYDYSAGFLVKDDGLIRVEGYVCTQCKHVSIVENQCY